MVVTKHGLLMANRFRAERNTLLRSLDPDRLDPFLIRWKHQVPKWPTDRPDAKLAFMHYARMQCDDMLAKEKLTSAQWLKENDYSLPSGFVLDGNKLIFNKPNDPDGARPNFGMEGLTLETKE